MREEPKRKKTRNDISEIGKAYATFSQLFAQLIVSIGGGVWGAVALKEVSILLSLASVLGGLALALYWVFKFVSKR